MPKTISMPPMWRRGWPGALALFTLALVTVYDRASPTDGAKSPDAPNRIAQDLRRYHDRTFRVARVVDGDTLDIESIDGDAPHTRIRLWGIDAPEMLTGDGTAAAAGRQSASFARDAVWGRDVHVVLSPIQTRDRYNRLLAYIFLQRGGPMLNELLIENGLARADTRFPHHYSQSFESAERRARRDGMGHWAKTGP